MRLKIIFLSLVIFLGDRALCQASEVVPSSGKIFDTEKETNPELKSEVESYFVSKEEKLRKAKTIGEFNQIKQDLITLLEKSITGTNRRIQELRGVDPKTNQPKPYTGHEPDPELKAAELESERIPRYEDYLAKVKSLEFTATSESKTRAARTKAHRRRADTPQ